MRENKELFLEIQKEEEEFFCKIHGEKVGIGENTVAVAVVVV